MLGLIRPTLAVGAGTLGSRVLGFVRDLVIARVFGADLDTDAFFVAFKVPNLLRRLFAEGTFSLVMVPTFVGYRATRGCVALRGYLDQVAGTFGGVLLLVTALGIIAAPLLVFLFAPGFTSTPHKQGLAVDLLRLTLPYLAFVSLTALAGSVLNSYQRFAVPAFTPVLLNLSLILCALWLSPQLQRPIEALAWGVLLGGLAQLAFQWAFLRRIGWLPRPRWAPREPEVRRLLQRMTPGLLGASVTQMTLLIETLFASFLVEGSISWLYYANRLVEFPLGILGTAIGTVIVPKLAQQHAGSSSEAFSHTLDWALRWVLLLGLPAAVGLAILAGPILTTLLHYGSFSAMDAEMSAQALRAYALGMFAALVVRALLPGFYARGELKVPVRIALVTLFVNLVLNFLFMAPLGHTGLALASSLATLLNAGLLLAGLLRGGIWRIDGDWWWRVLRTLLAAGAMAWVLHALCGDWAGWLLMPTPERLLRLGWLLLLGVGSYGMVLLVLGERLRTVRPDSGPV